VAGFEPAAPCARGRCADQAALHSGSASSATKLDETARSTTELQPRLCPTLSSEMTRPAVSGQTESNGAGGTRTHDLEGETCSPGRIRKRRLAWRVTSPPRVSTDSDKIGERLPSDPPCEWARSGVRTPGDHVLPASIRCHFQLADKSLMRPYSCDVVPTAFGQNPPGR
jgi:hypothetical protein